LSSRRDLLLFFAVAVAFAVPFPQKISPKSADFLPPQNTTTNKPHFPPISPSSHHKTTTSTTHFSQNPNKNAPSTTNKKTEKGRLAKAKPPFFNPHFP
jgi:hypothetical protein